jgi:iron complex outermembrane recepter protein
MNLLPRSTFGNLNWQLILVCLSLIVAAPIGARELRAQDSPQVPRLAQATPNIVTVTGVKLNPTANGLEVMLTTSVGGITAPAAQTRGNILYFDLPNATLSLADGKEFRVENPAQGITNVTVTQVTQSYVRVLVTGSNSFPNATLALTRGTSVAQDPSEPELEINVTGLRNTRRYKLPNATTATKTDTPLADIPQSIQVVPPQVIKDQQVRQLNDALRNVSGVSPANSFGGTAQQFNVRGFTQESILVDGFRQDSFGQAPPSDQLEQIEVLKGPASVLYGNIEPGGIINLVRKKPLENPYYAAGVDFGSFGFFQSNIDVSSPLNPDKTLLYRVNGSVQIDDGFWNYSQNVKRIDIAPTLTWQIAKNTSLRTDFSYLKEERPSDRGIVAIGTGIANIPFNRVLQDPTNKYEIDQITAGYQLDHKFSDDWQIRNSFKAVFSNTSYFRLESLDIEDSGILDRGFRLNQESRQNYSLQTNLTGKFATGSVKHQILAGVDLTRENGSTNQIRLPDDPRFPVNIFTLEGFPTTRPNISEFTSFASDDRAKNDLLGIYLQDQIAISDNVKMLVGGRFDLFNSTYRDIPSDFSAQQSDSKFSPRVGVVYQPIPQISLYTSYSQSFNPDIFSNTVNGDVIKPSVGTQYEVGIKGSLFDGKLATNLAAYQIRKTNIAITDPNNTDFVIPLGEVGSRGIELDIAGELLPGWKVIASYANTNAEVTNDPDRQGFKLVNIPTNSASLWTTYEIQQGNLAGLGFGTGVFFVGERPGDSDNTFVLPSYLRTDAALYYKKDNWKAALNFKNLFNVGYIESSFFRSSAAPGSPFAVTGSLSVEF